MIAIVDYGLGNVQALANIYKRLRIPAVLASSAADISGAERLILPGVGAFDWAMSRLNESGLRNALDEAVLERQVPVLGICVGMQMMANSSQEGRSAGLGWFEGEVKKFSSPQHSAPIQLPHMGWNDVAPRATNCLFRELGSDARFYFLHSYYFEPVHDSDVLSVTTYNGTYASSIRRGHVFGAQFHPEKSHAWGVRLLKNFAELHHA